MAAERYRYTTECLLFLNRPEGKLPTNMTCNVILGQDIECMEMLLMRGIDPNHHDGYLKCSMLAFACMNERIEMVKMLIRHCADLENKDSEGKTPLILAAYHGRKESIKSLLESKADPTAKDNDKQNALDRLGDFDWHGCGKLLRDAMTVRCQKTISLQNILCFD